TGVLTVKLVPATTVRVMPAPTAPKAKTLPNASVALLVPAPDDKATPAASELNTRLLDEFTGAVTVSDPDAVLPACAMANDEIIMIMAAVTVKRINFFIFVVPLLVS